MAYPIWLTNSNLGSYPSGSTVSVTISAATSLASPTSIVVLSADVPGTLSVDDITATLTIELDGRLVETSTDFQLVLRAINPDGITDRTFKLTLLAAPDITWTQSTLLPLSVLGAQYRLPMTAVWFWELEYVLVQGSLPPGLFLDSSGIIYGIPGSNLIATSANAATWQISGTASTSGAQARQFTIRARDPRAPQRYLDRSFTLNVVEPATLNASSTTYSVDSLLVDASASSRLGLVILEEYDDNTGRYGLGEYRHDNEFIRLIRVWNPRGYSLTYTLLSGVNAYDVAGYDSGTQLGYDGYDVKTIPFLSIEPLTGYLYGSLPTINVVQQQHEFSILIAEDSQAQVYNFELNLLGEYGVNFEFLDEEGSVIDPNTAYELHLAQGEISDLHVAARWIQAPPGQLLYYELASGDLPAGITLSPNGLLMGQVGWSAPTGDYNFAVRVYDPSLDQSLISPKFSQIQNYRLVVSQRVSGVTPVDRAYDIYYRAYLPLDQRTLWQNAVTDPRIFSNNIIYREEDQFYGRQLECEFLSFTGIQEHEAQEFAGAVGKNWDLKRFRFGELRSAIMRNDRQRHVCDVIYADIVDPHVNSERRGPPLVTKIRTTNSSFTITVDTVNYTGDDSSLTVDTLVMRNIYPATIENQLERLRQGPGQISDSLLPKWMATPQSDGRPLGLIPAAILCFVEPGSGEEILRKFRTSEHDLNQIDFHVDRMVLKRAPNTLFNITFDNAATTFDSGATTFDVAVLRDKYIYFRADGAIYDINN